MPIIYTTPYFLNIIKGVDTVMLLRFDNGFTDSANSERVLSSNGPSISTVKTKFGSHSLYVNGGRLAAPDVQELRLVGDYTVEFWVNIQTLLSDTWLFAKNNIGYINCLKTWNGNLYLQTETASAAIPAGGNMTTNAWQHYAVVHSGNKTMLFIDGVKKMDFVDNGGFGLNDKPFVVGGSSFESVTSHAYYDEFRVSKVARYTTDFTPPTAPFEVD